MVRRASVATQIRRTKYVYQNPASTLIHILLTNNYYLLSVCLMQAIPAAHISGVSRRWRPDQTSKSF